MARGRRRNWPRLARSRRVTCWDKRARRTAGSFALAFSEPALYLQLLAAGGADPLVRGRPPVAQPALDHRYSLASLTKPARTVIPFSDFVSLGNATAGAATK